MEQNEDGRFAATHGRSRSREYALWGNMLYRCNTPTAALYPLYGGRGIRVCDRWLSFENFLADMGQRPAGMSLERIDVDGDYEPGNCTWASAEQQARNRRNTRRVTIDGETRSLRDWCEHYGLSWNMVANRWRRHCPVENLFDPPRPYQRRRL